MYGRNITLVLKNQGQVIEVVTIYVFGTPELTEKEWEKRAKDKIMKMEIN